MRVALTTATLPLFSGAFSLPNVPTYPPNPISDDLPRSILLLEEYGALAVAISSALRKFASLHRVEVARSFAEAEAAAEKMRPELFVLDLDPPPSGEIEFLGHLQARYPHARALVIAAGTSRELRTERGTAGALQFIEKPFDLAEFGAAVQALVGPWTGPAGSVRGTLRDLGIIDIVLVKCLADSTALVHLAMADGRTGEIHFQKGQIIHAATGILAGLSALDEMLHWSDARISETESPAEGPRTIDIVRDDFLLATIRKLTGQKKENSPTGSPNSPSSRGGNGRRILVIDDTEMLLIFVADVLANADSSFQIFTASSGGDGIKLASEVNPDLILLDYCLSDMMGDAVCQALLENERTTRIPVLMMSGHLTELMRTANDYSNVIAALPKPFLSGALINAVEKALEAGPLPKPASPKAAPQPAPSAAAEDSVPVSPNGHVPGEDGAATKPSAAATSAVTIVEDLPAAAKPITPPKPTSAAVVGGAVGDPAVRPAGTALKVTFSLEIVALRLTPLLQMEVVRLQPVHPIVAVEREQGEGETETVLETGFRLGKVETASGGQIESLRLIPTRESFELPEAANSFAVGEINLRRADSHRDLELVAASDAAMSVQLTASFELLRVELSPGFEIGALLVRARGTRVFIRNRETGEGTPFELEEVELDPAGELHRLLVRPSA